MVLPVGLPIKLPIELPIVARLDPAWFPPVSPGLAGRGRLGWGRGWALARGFPGPYLVHGSLSWSMVHGPSMVRGPWSMVHGPWSKDR